MKRLIQVVIAGIATFMVFFGFALCVLVWKADTPLRHDRDAEMASRLRH